MVLGVQCVSVGVRVWRRARTAVHAGRETGKLADKDLPAAVKSNSVLEFPTIWRVPPELLIFIAHFHH
jgi:hypothetical protein